MKKLISLIFAIIIILTPTSCGCNEEKEITVVVREDSSGTREAFDNSVVKNGEALKGSVTNKAVIHNKTGLVLTAVAGDESAIGYVSIGSINDTVNVVRVNGVMPTEENVLNGSYSIQRPFVIMTSEQSPLTLRAEDFLSYLKSDASKKHSKSADTIFIESSENRANKGKAPIEIVSYEKKEELPKGVKIVIRGSTSMERFINSAVKGYAELYGVEVEDIFDIELQGSSIGKSAVENDSSGNVIGLSSVYVDAEGIESFNVCLDAVAVIVNKRNTLTTSLTKEQLYDIFTGNIKAFGEIK